MDRHGERFLADAAFALDQDGGTGARGLGGDGQRGAEVGGVADDLVKGEKGGNLLGQRAKLTAGLARDTGLQRGEQPFGGERLDQEVGRTGADPCRFRRDPPTISKMIRGQPMAKGIVPN